MTMEDALLYSLVFKHTLKIQAYILKRSVLELRDRARSDSIEQLANVACVDWKHSVTVQLYM